ncbi:MAG: heme exporter protein CcmB [Sandaracinus sp.]|nr:heme exporter protein CcmB [Sandaracinus sp.]
MSAWRSAKEMWRGARLVAGKDLRIEARTKEITVTTAFFAVLVVVLSSLAFYLDRNTAKSIAPGVLWVAVVFAGITSVLRSWGRERESAARASCWPSTAGSSCRTTASSRRRACGSTARGGRTRRCV